MSQTEARQSSQTEARQLIEDVDMLLQMDAENPHARERLNTLREELQHVEATGEWPSDGKSPWHRFTESDGA